MIAIQTGGIPRPVANALVSSGNFVNRLFSRDPWYFFGQDSYESRDFEENHLTHSAIRYQLFTELYEQNQDIQLGGVTFQWLVEAIKANQEIFAEIDKIETPVLVLQSGADTIVDNEAQDAFCKQLHQANPSSCPDGVPVVIDGAKHELFFETDRFRIPALHRAIDWFSQN